MDAQKTHNGQDVVNPSVSNPECDETKDERRNWNTQRDHDGPNTHVPAPLLSEERLGDDTGTDRSRRADEEGRDGTAETHGRVRVGVGTANVADQTANEGDDEDGSATVALRNGTPEERRYSEDADDQGGEVASGLDFDLQVLGDVHEGGHDGCSSKSSHHGVEGDEEEIHDFLFGGGGFVVSLAIYNQCIKGARGGGGEGGRLTFLCDQLYGSASDISGIGSISRVPWRASRYWRCSSDKEATSFWDG